jgi:hypothetical protein
MVIISVPSFDAVLIFWEKTAIRQCWIWWVGRVENNGLFFNQEIHTHRRSCVNRCVVRWINQYSRLIKGRNLTSDDAINWQLWQMKTSDCWTTGKLIYIYILDLIHTIGARMCMCTHMRTCACTDSWNSAVSIVARLWAGLSGVRNPAGALYFSLLCNVQTNSGAKPAS